MGSNIMKTSLPEFSSKLNTDTTLYTKPSFQLHNFHQKGPCPQRLQSAWANDQKSQRVTKTFLGRKRSRNIGAYYYLTMAEFALPDSFLLLFLDLFI